jgi:cytoskeletal protein RodZ
MEKKSKWVSPQSLIVILIVVLIMAYIGVDAFKTKPFIKQEVEMVKMQYDSLSRYLNEKLPEIDSTLKEHSSKIIKQTTDIEGLKISIDELAR